jgi:hypothetical protein
MDFKRATGKSIQQGFESFHQNNPFVFDMIVNEVLRAKKKGKKKISIKMIVNFIRWNIYVETKDDSSSYKINDAYTSRYARMLVEKYPSFETMIEKRILRA